MGLVYQRRLSYMVISSSRFLSPTQVGVSLIRVGGGVDLGLDFALGGKA